MRYTVDVEWKAIHKAAARVDDARRGSHQGAQRVLGYDGSYVFGTGPDGISDAFGGTYWGDNYEPRGLAGLYDIAVACRRIARDAWEVIHGANEQPPDFAVPQARVAVRTALALDPLMRLLGATGIIEYRPDSTICGVTDDDRLRVTGLRWLAGEAVEPEDGWVSVEDARKFVTGAGVEIFARPKK